MERKELTIEDKIKYNIEKILRDYKRQRRKNLTNYRRARNQSNWIKCHDLKISGNWLNAIIFQLEIALDKPISEIEQKKLQLNNGSWTIKPGGGGREN